MPKNFILLDLSTNSLCWALKSGLLHCSSNSGWQTWVWKEIIKSQQMLSFYYRFVLFIFLYLFCLASMDFPVQSVPVLPHFLIVFTIPFPCAIIILLSPCAEINLTDVRALQHTAFTISLWMQRYRRRITAYNKNKTLVKRLPFLNVLSKFCSAALTVLKTDVPNLSRLCMTGLWLPLHRQRIWQHITRKSCLPPV